MSNSISVRLAFFMMAIAAIVMLRLPSYYEPLEGDLTVYAVIAHEWLQGRLLYSDLWDIKPPGVFVTYALAELAVGYGGQSVFLLNIVFAIINLFGVYTAAHHLSKSVPAAYWAATIWVLIGGHLVLQANQPNVEVFMNACLIWAFAILLKRPGTYGLLGVGVLFALATYYKQIAIIAAALLSLAYVFSLKPTTWQSTTRTLVLLALPGCALWFGVFAYFAYDGRWLDFYQATFGFNRAYALEIRTVDGIPTNLPQLLLSGFEGRHLLPEYFDIALPLLVFSVLGFGRHLAQGQQNGLLTAAYLFAIPLMIAFPGKYFGHYYQLWLPLLAVLSGYGIIALREIIKFAPRILEWGAGIALCLVLIVIQWPTYGLSPIEMSQRKYGNFFVLTEQSGREIGQLLAPDEYVYLWGGESGLFFYSQRPISSGIFFYTPLLFGPYTEQYTARVLQDLQQYPPELVVLPKQFGDYPASRAIVVNWLSPRYLPMPGNEQRDSRFQLYYRRDGALQARLHLPNGESLGVIQMP